MSGRAPTAAPRFTRVRRYDEAAVVTVSRRDRGYLAPAQEGANGAPVVEGIFAVSGVHLYVERDDRGNLVTFRELTDDSVLEAWAGQMAYLPVTLDHPDRAQHPQGVTPENIGALMVGMTGGQIDFIRRPAYSFIRGPLSLQRADAIEAARAGTHTGLSCGYDAIIDNTPGEHPVYGKYDRKVVRREKSNHIATCENPRHGDLASFRADSAAVDGLEDGVAVQLHTDAATAPSLTGPEELVETRKQGAGSVRIFTRNDTADAGDSAVGASPNTPSSTEDTMDPILLALAATLGVTRTDGMSDKDFSAAIVRAVTDARSAAAEAVQARADAGDMAAMKKSMDKVRDMMGSHLKDAEGYAADMEFGAMADMFGKHVNAMKAAKDVAEKKLADMEKAAKKKADDDERARLDQIVAGRKIDGIEEAVSKGDDVGAYRRAVADALAGKSLADQSDDYVKAYIDHAAQQDAGSQTDDEDRRYDGFTGGSRTDSQPGGEGGSGGQGGGSSRTDELAAQGLTRTDSRFRNPDFEHSVYDS